VLTLVNLDMGNSAITNYGGCLIASKKSGIQSIQDIATSREKSLALVNTSSTSGKFGAPPLVESE